jgi:formate-dependent nitrite reductase membrane component NrfD
MSLDSQGETAVSTYYDRPILKQPVWIWTVPAYFYVGGVAGAALVLGAAAQLDRDSNIRQLVRTLRWIGAIGTTVGSILLIADLGRPERFYNMLRVLNTKSPLSIGSWILAGAGTASALSLTASRRLADAAGVAAGVMGIPLAGYTGVLLCNSAVPVWRGARRFLPALFVASSIASCASLFEMMQLSEREERIVRRFGLIGKAAELLCMPAVEAELAGNVRAVQPLLNGVAGTLWTASKVLTAASLILTLAPGQSTKRRAAGLLGTLAGVGLRFAIFHAGFSSARDPRAAV